MWWRIPLAVAAAASCIVLTVGAARWLRDLLRQRRSPADAFPDPRRTDLYSAFPGWLYWQTVLGLIVVTPVLAVAAVLVPVYVLTR
jgi:hypothetical protein